MTLCTLDDAGVVTAVNHSVSDKRKTIIKKGAKITFLALLCLSPLVVGFCNQFKVFGGLKKAYKLVLIGSGTGLSSVYLALGLVYRENRKVWQKCGNHNGIKIEMATWNMGTDRDFWNTRVLPHVYFHCGSIIQKALSNVNESNLQKEYDNFVRGLKKIALRDGERFFSNAEINNYFTFDMFKNLILEKSKQQSKMRYFFGAIRVEESEMQECCNNMVNNLFSHICHEKRQPFLQSAFAALRDNDVICLQERDGYSLDELAHFLRAEDGTTLFTITEIEGSNYTAVAVKKQKFTFVGQEREDLHYFDPQTSSISYWRHQESNTTFTVASAHIYGNPNAVHIGDSQCSMLVSKVSNNRTDIKIIAGDFNWSNRHSGRLNVACDMSGFSANNGNAPTRISMQGDPVKIDYVLAKGGRNFEVASNATKEQKVGLGPDSFVNPSDHAPVETTLVVRNGTQMTRMQKLLEVLF